MTLLFGQGFKPREAEKRMQPADGLQVQLFASEPQVRQPIFVKCDDRGRIWTIQYLQYPNPAGLKRVQVDRWSRTVYDRMPEPPPRGPKGDDRITICEDTDGDGRADRVKDFVTGLNLCTGLEFGHGGVYVLQAPYLLFYPDRNRDDVPDGDPEVLLTGFGMEDAQSLANHLTWGPDGWLYGLNGSTTTCRIRGIEFQQGVWRYHPQTHEFELFCEGGGNVYGLTFDENGNLFYSSNLGLFWHAHQGAYYFKNLGKHGPLHNPHAYGWLMHTNHDAPTGGPTTGGTIYKGDTFPERFKGRFLAGDFLRHTVSVWQLNQKPSSYDAHFQELLFDSKDTWFGATDLCLGHDGAIYVSDFYDKRTAHPDPDADWDRSNGRIYRVQAQNAKTAPKIELTKLDSNKLVDLFSHPNGWFGDRARVLLAERRDPAVIDRLKGMARKPDVPRLSLQALWSLNASGQLEPVFAEEMLNHTQEWMRIWAVRLLGDRHLSSPQFVTLATKDLSPRVRAQLLCSVRRLKAVEAWPVIEHLLSHSEDLKNQVNLWLAWWAIETHAITAKDAIVRYLKIESHRQLPLVQAHLGKILRRYVSEGTAIGYESAIAILESMNANEQLGLLDDLDKGLAERSQALAEVGQGGLFDNLAAPERKTQTSTKPADPVSPRLIDWIRTLHSKHRDKLSAQRLALRVELKEAREQLLTDIQVSQLSRIQRIQCLQLLTEFPLPEAIPTVTTFLSSSDAGVVSSALKVLGKQADPEIARAVLKAYPQFTAPFRSQARDLLFARKPWASLYLEQIEAKKLRSDEVPMEQVRLLSFLKDTDLDARVRKIWGNISPGTSEEKLADMRRFANDLRAGTGDAVAGKSLFLKHCGVCHKLFGEGGAIGPDLTSSSRADNAWLLASIVDPSAVIRTQYLQFAASLQDGGVRTGLIAEQDPASVTLVDAKGDKQRIARNQLESLRELPNSIMPEKLLEPLSPQERRDLFRYLQSTGK